MKDHLQNLSALPWQDSASQETTGDQEWQDNSPVLVTAGSWLVYAVPKLMESTIQWDKRTVFHTSYFSVMYCHYLSVSVVVVFPLVFAIGLAETAPTDWNHGERLLLALFHLFWAGCIITVYCYWYGLPSWSQSPYPLTYVCILLQQEMLSLGLCFSIGLCHCVMHSQSCHLSSVLPW
jgi:hypothetical protein